MIPYKITDRMKLIRNLTRELHMCPHCFIRPKGKDTIQCEACSATASTLARKHRADPERCNRCGQKNDTGKKYCDRCKGYIKTQTEKMKKKYAITRKAFLVGECNRLEIELDGTETLREMKKLITINKNICR